MKYTHFIISQFNVKVNRGKKGNVWPKSTDWCKSRLEILKKYTLPSLLNQTDTNFEWLVFVDVNTDKSILDEMRNLCSFLKVVTVRGEFNHSTHIIQYLINNHKLSEYLITTMLDADDCLHRDYIKNVHEIIKKQKKQKYFIHFRCGLRYHTLRNIMWKLEWRYNPFMTVVEKVPSNPHALKTCKANYFHYMIAKILGEENELYVKEEPMWLHILHNNNVGSIILDDEAIQIQDSKYDRYVFEKLNIKNLFGIEI